MKHSSTEVFWPRDLLPEKVPNARIMVWGYDSRIVSLSKTSTATTFDHAETLLCDIVSLRGHTEQRIPLIFVAHSLGGIIVKDALCTSRLVETSYKTVLPATTAVAFLGTPHEGSRSASLGKVIVGLLRPIFPSSNTALLRTLEENSETLRRISRDFGCILDSGHLKVHSFQEELETFGTKVVSADSSTVNYLREARCNLHGDHQEIARFSSQHDTNFLRVSSVIQDWVTDIGSRGIESDISLSLSKLNITERPDDVVFDEAYRQCLASLDDCQSRIRLDTIQPAYSKTYSWLYDHDIGFKPWLQGTAESNIFWISGKPGSGKSTLMKYAMMQPLTERFLRKGRSMPWLITGYFFHDRGSTVQKSIQGFLSEILYQLLHNRPELFPLIHLLYRQLNEQSKTWKVDILCKVLLTIWQSSDTPLNCCLFVDALDEEDGHHKELISTLFQLAHFGDNPQVRVRLCLAGRPQNIFEHAFKQCPGFSVHTHTKEDICHYTHDRIHAGFKGRAGQQDQEVMSHLVREIVKKANGVFLWVRLAVAEMIEGLIEGDSLTDLKDMLDDLPTELSDLYARTLQRRCRTARTSIERQKTETYVMCQLVCAALEPIPLKELIRAAMYFSTGATNQGSVSMSYDQMRRRLNSSSRGLLEAVNPVTSSSSSRNVTVQFIHQTVKEFMGQENGSNIIKNGVSTDIINDNDVLMFRYILEHMHATPRNWASENFVRYGQVVEDRGKVVDEWFAPRACVSDDTIRRAFFSVDVYFNAHNEKRPIEVKEDRFPPHVKILLLYIYCGFQTSMKRFFALYEHDLDKDACEALLMAAFDCAQERAMWRLDLMQILLTPAIGFKISQTACDELGEQLRRLKRVLPHSELPKFFEMRALWFNVIQQAGNKVPSEPTGPLEDLKLGVMIYRKIRLDEHPYLEPSRNRALRQWINKSSSY